MTSSFRRVVRKSKNTLKILIKFKWRQKILLVYVFEKMFWFIFRFRTSMTVIPLNQLIRSGEARMNESVALKYFSLGISREISVLTFTSWFWNILLKLLLTETLWLIKLNICWMHCWLSVDYNEGEIMKQTKSLLKRATI